MDMVLTIAGDLLWAVALAIMVGVSRHAWRRTSPTTQVPFLGARVGRGVAFWLVPTAAFLFSLGLAFHIRTNPGEGAIALIQLAARATSASLAALLHLSLVRGALQTLEKEGALKP